MRSSDLQGDDYQEAGSSTWYGLFSLCMSDTSTQLEDQPWYGRSRSRETEDGSCNHRNSSEDMAHELSSYRRHYGQASAGYVQRHNSQQHLIEHPPRREQEMMSDTRTEDGATTLSGHSIQGWDGDSEAGARPSFLGSWKKRLQWSSTSTYSSGSTKCARPDSFHPIELRMLQEDPLSPLSSYFVDTGDVIQNPAAARLAPARGKMSRIKSMTETDIVSNLRLMTRERKEGRPRANRAPNKDLFLLMDRISGSMAEVDRLQHQIDKVLEKQGGYLHNRPWSPNTTRALDLKFPTRIPAVPPKGPSFSQRLQSDRMRGGRVRTGIPRPTRQSTGQSLPKKDGLAPPPLPLILRPPLNHKSRSVSRVSSWLKPDHERGIRTEAVTNAPQPLRANQGFYQTIEVDAHPDQFDRESLASASSAQTLAFSSTGTESSAATLYSPDSVQGMRMEKGRAGAPAGLPSRFMSRSQHSAGSATAASIGMAF